MKLSEIIMFDEIGVDGKSSYKKGDWKKYAIWDENSIKGFFGEERYLSNFELCDIWYEGLKYTSSEAAYQSQKVDPDYRHHFTKMTPYQSKKEWKKYPLCWEPEDWDRVKYNFMAAIVFEKFYRNEGLRYKLLQTENKELVELNHWSDIDWGVDIRKGGENNLGKILMKVRSFWK